jgi:long-subunit acyl-CoA synthetase (AMP-forming)
VTYYLLASGGRVVYSSIRSFKADLKHVKPNFLVCVPLVLDTLHSRIMSTIKKARGFKKQLAAWLIDLALIHTRVRHQQIFYLCVCAWGHSTYHEVLCIFLKFCFMYHSFVLL